MTGIRKLGVIKEVPGFLMELEPRDKQMIDALVVANETQNLNLAKRDFRV